jgi:hypothetical protein
MVNRERRAVSPEYNGHRLLGDCHFQVVTSQRFIELHLAEYLAKTMCELSRANVFDGHRFQFFFPFSPWAPPICSGGKSARPVLGAAKRTGY